MKTSTLFVAAALMLALSGCGDYHDHEPEMYVKAKFEAFKKLGDAKYNLQSARGKVGTKDFRSYCFKAETKMLEVLNDFYFTNRILKCDWRKCPVHSLQYKSLQVALRACIKNFGENFQNKEACLELVNQSTTAINKAIAVLENPLHPEVVEKELAELDERIANLSK